MRTSGLEGREAEAAVVEVVEVQAAVVEMQVAAVEVLAAAEEVRVAVEAAARLVRLRVARHR